MAFVVALVVACLPAASDTAQGLFGHVASVHDPERLLMRWYTATRVIMVLHTHGRSNNTYFPAFFAFYPKALSFRSSMNLLLFLVFRLLSVLSVLCCMQHWSNKG